MPPIETAELNQKAMLFVRAGTSEDGRPTWYHPVEIKVRWEWVKAQVVATGGEVTGTDATVVVDRRIEDGSRMWLGSSSEWHGTGSADTEVQGELMEVV